MFFMLSQAIIYGLIVFLGLGGLTVSSYLHYKKKRSVEGMACPMEGSCEDVITSKYSKFLGLDVEVLGIAYYAIIVMAYTLFSFTQVAPSWFTFGVLLSSITAVMFSAYLTFIQAFNLKKWCTWCLTSATFTAGILILSVAGPNSGLEALMAEFSPVLLWFSVVGASIGLGATIAFDSLYLTYLKDFEISKAQADSLNTLTHLVWTAIAVTAVGTLGLALGNPELLNQSAFQASAFILGALVVVETVYSLYLSDKMSELTFADKDENSFESEKQNSFLLASISTASWTVLLTLQILEPEMNVYNILSVYMAIIAVLGLGGLSMSSVMKRKAEGTLPDWSPLH